MPNTATRLITLIMLLQNKPNQKAADLADQLEVSVRTIHRYFNMLEEMGIPIYSERGPHGGFSMVRGYKMPPLIFTPEEAVAISLGVGMVSDVWGSLYKEGARGAQAKLDNVLPEDQRREIAWAKRALVANVLQRSDFEENAPRLEIFRKARKDFKQVLISYQSTTHPEPQ
ncbi:MAG: HTH domain-containing protein, partial [Anaerolineaceae bacterium]|nr:HTH domain-containing protein [Anaerolineaceae bacterium]